MTNPQTQLTVECQVHFQNARFGRKHMAAGAAAPRPPTALGRVPRVARLMALALRFQQLLAGGEVHDYADLARLGHVTRARTTQIMNLLNLAPDIQEELLFLPPTLAGRDPIQEWQVRPIMAQLEWSQQRQMWRKLKRILAGKAASQ